MLSRNLSRFKLVTFDITETLLKFRKPPALQYKQTAEEFGITTIDDTKLVNAFRLSFKTLSKQYPNYGYGSEITWHEWWRQLVIQVLTLSSAETLCPYTVNAVAMTLIDKFETDECWEKYAKSNEIVTKMQEAGQRVGVISNFDPRLQVLLKNMQFPSFDFVLTSYEAGVLKPHKGIFDKALLHCQDCKISPAEALHVGNKYEADCKGATDAGWKGVLIKTGEDDSARQEQGGCHVYHSLDEFLDALEKKEIKW